MADQSENYFENWNDTTLWTTDGSLQYDERNKVLYFDKAKFTEKLPDVSEDYDVAALRKFEIPDGSHGFYFSVTLGNSSPLADNNGGRIDVEFYDANGIKTVEIIQLFTYIMRRISSRLIWAMTNLHLSRKMQALWL